MRTTGEVGIPETIGRVRSRVGGAKAYVSFDVDSLDPVFAPGTGTPEINVRWELGRDPL